MLLSLFAGEENKTHSEEQECEDTLIALSKERNTCLYSFTSLFYPCCVDQEEKENKKSFTELKHAILSSHFNKDQFKDRCILWKKNITTSNFDQRSFSEYTLEIKEGIDAILNQNPLITLDILKAHGFLDSWKSTICTLHYLYQLHEKKKEKICNKSILIIIIEGLLQKKIGINNIVYNKGVLFCDIPPFLSLKKKLGIPICPKTIQEIDNCFQIEAINKFEKYVLRYYNKHTYFGAMLHALFCKKRLPHRMRSIIKYLIIALADNYLIRQARK